MNPRKTFEQNVLENLFSSLEGRPVRYAILRNYETLPYSVGARDIDILVPPQDLEAAIEVICSVASRFDLLFASYYRDDMITQFTLSRRIGQNQMFDIKIDLLHNRQVYGVEIYSAAQMLCDLRTHNGIRVVPEKYIFLDKWLFHIFVGKPMHPKYDDIFAGICRRKKDSLSDDLGLVFGKTRAEELIAGVALGKASEVPVLSLRLRLSLLARILARRGVHGIGHFFRFLAYRFQNLVLPQGFFLSVSGPDGSGKTTVIDAVIAELKTVYGDDSITYRHFRPNALPRIADVAKAAHAIDEVDEEYSSPHRAKPSGVIGSLARVGYYYTDYLVGYVRSIRPLLQKRQIVLFDRYYYDMIGDPGRSRINLPDFFLRLVGRLLPLPHYSFFIHVEPGEVYRRKQELSLDRITELNARYHDLARRGMLIEVDNNGQPRDAVAYIVDTIIGDRDLRARRKLEKYLG